ncbi:F-box/LRR-repeat protein 2-like [Lutzomyia longipalpis]|uniref:F-box/LRR-repeat protein 2-like n=1 Tax=Lutzomyia longipalpis TaxID=7200 RepID=UPI0024846227|nr:F-box/LRR-repeat protein 2-like [Lutzomyia longipalpis]
MEEHRNKKRKLQDKVGRARIPSFTELPFDVFDKIVDYLTLQELLAFRSISKYCFGLVDCSLRAREVLDVDKEKICCATHFQVILLLCRRLRKISLMNGAKWLTDDICADLIRNNPRLEIFELGFTKITTKGLEPLINCEKLAVLTLYCMNIRDDFLEAMSRTHKNLVEINLTLNDDLTGKGIATLVAKQPRLRFLAIPDLNNNDPIAKAIIKNCPDFRCIYLPNHHIGSDKALEKMAKLCPKLEVISLSEHSKHYEHTMRYVESKGVKLTQDYFVDYEFYKLKN